MSTPAGTSRDPFTAVRDGEREAIYAELTAQGPVHPVTMPTGRTAWLITGHAEARRLLSDPRLVKGGWENGVYARMLPEHVARGVHTRTCW